MYYFYLARNREKLKQRDGWLTKIYFTGVRPFGVPKNNFETEFSFPL